ncbi:uncharacterized protein LOC127749351 [Frankliniella occidentalis]|uniref:Uncharacterized protein LOC127749351 n=1 Tax=Frankliniella occidentalis TaxID=133901 RepID=A0A9C6UAT6_FRAOC|nr:uncharacterized protein LOC127749351 [Frankliniella occidentalis]XP_052123210.1 uncharacterized protein LOC127749351 [Frankliniella occidentalis]XP_052123211.1 uncharacterized protein LOC127749351 [Frankliniella occidentalis]
MCRIHWAGFLRHIKRHVPVQAQPNIELAVDYNLDVDNFEGIPVVDNINANDDDNVNGGGDNVDRYSLQYFVESHYEQVEYFVAELYAHPNTSRKLVGDVLKNTAILIASTVKILKNNAFPILVQCDGHDTFPDDCDQLDKMFDVLLDCFEPMNTEYKRFCELERVGELIRPEPFLMGLNIYSSHCSYCRDDLS